MEHKEINRGWVKNAAIIFLAVLLVLTFFSNTIMNRTLPEVATQSVTSGSITARVRGTGTVVANGSIRSRPTRPVRSAPSRSRPGRRSIRVTCCSSSVRATVTSLRRDRCATRS